MAIDLDVHGNTKPLEAAVQAAVNRIRRTPIKITVDDKGATQPLGNMKRAADEFSKSMEAANARILAFGASMAIINGVADAFKGMVRNMVEVEKSLADINVVMGLSAQNLDKFGDGLFKVAKETGAAFRVAADAATEYARQGLSVEESLKRTRDALVLTRLTGMDSAEAVKSLTAAMNTYGNQIKDTTQLVSKFAAVDVQFAVSAEDFAAAISRTGQAAKSAGVDIDELIGIVTSAQQQTARGGAVIGNALKTIFTKTGRTDTLNQLENLGIAVRDLEGNTIGAKRILSELANTFDDLTESQKAQITQTMGGLFHINILKAVLSDAAKQNGILARATQISAGATDEAIQKNQQLRETMSALATETGLAIKEVSAQVGEIALAPGMEKILNTVKSLAEGLSGVLGDGEGMGNKFATGLLKGIGNIITGPGLVVLTTVFFKLFGQAVKFTRESLSSLVGVTTEKQKQKAIETSLVALFGQNAALNKEMLRTDISRTEKEKILLGLLKAQVAEASRLSKLTGGMAASLYRQGYGANLMPIGKKRAYGHIPNFAHPERVQAAQGGYAAGNIRSMSMPGEGSVIYNSAEKIKNFAGFKQPAIMPPLSSKAGKNYQQAFGSVHGFDPYAAEGFIPNFALSPGQILNNALTAKRTTNLTKIASGEKISGQSFSQEQRNAAAAALQRRSGKNKSTAATSDLMRAKFPLLNPGGAQYVLLSASPGPEPGRSSYYVGNETMLSRGMSDRAYIHPSKFFNKEGRMLKGVNGRKVDVPIFTLDAKDKNLKSPKNKTYQTQIYDTLKKTGQGLTNRILRQLGMGEYVGKRDILDNRDVSAMGGNIFEAVIGSVLGDEAFKDYAGRGATARIDLPYDPELYKLFGVDKSSVKAALGAEAKISGSNDNAKDAAKKFYDMLMGGRAATGFIPNFANPLSDAIGRERAAGVPVSQIRVGSHNALMSKGNPLGLGVTNTKDEPNGLKDVFGANGFVPNYAFNPFGMFSPDEQAQDKISSLNRKIERQEKAVSDHTKSLKNLKAGTDKYNRTQQLLNQTTANLQKTRTQVSSLERRGLSSSMKRIGGVMNGGMGAIGLGMLSGFVNDPTLSSSLAYASTGGQLGSMLTPILGPFGTLIGTAAGGLYGFINGLEEAEKASKELAKAKQEERLKQLSNVSQGNVEALSAAFNKISQRDAASIFKGSNINVRSASGIKGGINIPIQNLFKDQKVETILKDLKGDAFRSGGRLEFEINKALVSQSSKGFAEKIDEALSADNKQRSVNILQNLFKTSAGRTSLAATTGGSVIPMNISGDAKYTNAGAVKGGFFGLTKDQKRFGQLIRTATRSDNFYEASGASETITNETLAIAEEVSRSIKSGEFMKNLSKEQLSSLAKQGVQGSAGLDYFGTGQRALTSSIMQSLYRNAPKEMMFDAVTGFKEEDGKSIGITQKFNPQQYAEFLESDKFASMDDTEKDRILQEAKNALLNKIDQENSARDKMIASLVKQIDLQSASLDAQSTFNANMHKINSSFAGIANQYTFREKTMGRFMSQSEKNELKYNKSLVEINRKYTQAVSKNTEDSKQSLISSLSPFTGTLSRHGYTSEQLSGMNNEQLKKVYESLKDEGESSTAIQKTIDASTKSLKNKNDEAARSLKLSLEELMNQKEIEDTLLRQKRGPQAFQYGFAAEQTKMRESAAELDHQLGGIVATNFRDGLVSGMRAAINQAEDLGDVLQNVAMSFLQSIQSAYLTAAANQIVGAIPMPGINKYRGGAIRKYNRGGGVPAMVTNGEYVMSAAAVSKYGGSFMHSLNAGGKIPGFSNGGSAVSSNFGGGRGYKSGRAYQSRAMSGFFYSQSGNVGIGEDREALLGVLAEEERQRQAAAAKKAKRKALWKQLLGTALSAGISYGIGKMDLAKPKITAPEGMVNTFNRNIPNQFYGGPIRKYANGGYISGKSGIDQIPAMLSEGEYVIRASSARQLGKPMLDQINAGKFNDGGAVTELSNKSETSPSSGNTNNINISINMDRGGSSQKSKDSSGQNPAERSTEEQNSAALADRIKQQVVAVIVEEQRPGGLLNEKS
jgi:TP901 family phage tail tape measure protein